MIRFSVKPVQASWRERGRRGLYVFLKITVGDFEFEASNGSLQPWSHARLHKREYSQHLVLGRLSVTWGTPGLEPIHVCSACYGPIKRVGEYGDSLDWCEGCQQLEGDTEYITLKEYEARS